MPAVHSERDRTAKLYARRLLSVDPGLREIFYLPVNAPDDEIRLIAVNELIAELKDEAVLPIDTGADGHKLLLIDVTPSQWQRIGDLLPEGWSLQDAVGFSKS